MARVELLEITMLLTAQTQEDETYLENTTQDI